MNLADDETPTSRADVELEIEGGIGPGGVTGRGKIAVRGVTQRPVHFLTACLGTIVVTTVAVLLGVHARASGPVTLAVGAAASLVTVLAGVFYLRDRKPPASSS